MEHVLLAAEEANQSEEEPEIVTDEDGNRRITAAEALKKIKNFIEANGSDYLKIKVSLDLKIYFIYSGFSYRMTKILDLNFCCLFCPNNPKLCIADNWL